MLVQPGNRSVRSCVRACERSCVCPRDDVVSVAGRFLGKSPPGRRGAARALPRRWSRRAFSSLPVASKWFLVAPRCFPLLPVASRCFPLLPVRVSIANQCLSMRLDTGADKSLPLWGTGADKSLPLWSRWAFFLF